MPRFDRTGPRGLGPKTGRGRGICRNPAIMTQPKVISSVSPRPMFMPPTMPSATVKAPSVGLRRGRWLSRNAMLPNPMGTMLPNPSSNKKVVESWAMGRPDSSGTLFTDGNNLFSYKLKIGITDEDGLKYVYNYTAPSNFKSKTTSTHVKMALRYARAIPPAGSKPKRKKTVKKTKPVERPIRFIELNPEPEKKKRTKGRKKMSKEEYIKKIEGVLVKLIKIRKLTPKHAIEVMDWSKQQSASVLKDFIQLLYKSNPPSKKKTRKKKNQYFIGQ